MTGSIIWEPRHAAYRDIVRLTLHRLGGELRDDEGKATARLLEECGLTRTKAASNNLSAAVRLMETEGLIERRVEKTRTYFFKLPSLLTEAEESLLSTKQGPNLALCEKSGRPSEKHDKGDWLTPLFNDCLKAQKALRKAFEGAENATSRLAVFNATKVLEGVGLKGKRADEVRYYLREFGLARSTTQFEGDSHLWWWEVSLSKELDREKLRKKAMGPRAYGGFRRRAPLEDVSQTRRHAKGISPHLADELCGPVTVRKKPLPLQEEVRTESPEAVSQAVEVAEAHPSQDERSEIEPEALPHAPESASEISRSRFEELILAAETLEEALAKSEAERTQLLDDLESQIRQHAEERERLAREHESARKVQLDEFRRQLEEQTRAHNAALEELQAELQKEKARADEAQAELSQRADSLISRVKRRLKNS